MQLCPSLIVDIIGSTFLSVMLQANVDNFLYNRRHLCTGLLGLLRCGISKTDSLVGSSSWFGGLEELVTVCKAIYFI